MVYINSYYYQQLGGYSMGFFSSFFNKAGSWHVKQLTKSGVDRIIKATMGETNQVNNPHLVDATLTKLIEIDGVSIMEDREYDRLEEKFCDFLTFYVVRNLGREIDFSTGENVVLTKEVESYWKIFEVSKNGVVQELIG